VRAQVNLASLLLVAIPAAEVTFALVRRRRSRRSVVEGDRGHPYDQLVARGWSTRRAAAAYVATGLALGATAVASSRSRSTSLPAIAVGTAAAIMVGVATATGLLEATSDEA
jgi:UDP-N-acetylmuramyl pentapeptide phosphotransferase/UDP-N-acetylglucosamine-1-phosphate transferase